MKSQKLFLLIKMAEKLNLEVYPYVELLFYVHGKHLWSCQDGQLT